MAIYLVRHGQDDESVRGGWCHHGLLPEGVEQSQKLGDELADVIFDKIYASDLNRAMETACIIQEKLNHKREVIYTDCLREINNGVLAGMKHEVAEGKYPGLYYSALGYHERYPSGESPKEFYDRISDFWLTEINLSSNKNILLVTHGGVINILLHLVNEITYSNKETKFPIGTGTFIKIDTNQSSCIDY